MKRLLLIAVLCGPALAFAGCGKKPAPPAGPASAGGDGNGVPAPAGPKAGNGTYAAGELSTVPGVSIRPGAAPGAEAPILAGRGDSGRVLCVNATLYEAVREWCSFDGPVVDEGALPQGPFDITADPPDPNGAAWPLVREAIEKAFAVRIRQTRKEMDVYVLQKGEGTALGVTRAEPNSPRTWATAQTPAGLGYRAKNASMDALTEILEEYTGTDVVDETGLEGGYDFELAMDHWKPETAFAAVEKLGLRLVKAKRPTEVLTIEKAGP